MRETTLTGRQRYLGLLRNKHVHAVCDQVILSGASFVTAFVVIGRSGVESFGIYSVILVFCILAQQSLASFLHGQMTLRTTGRARRVQNSALRSTLTLCTLIYLGAALLVVLLVSTIGEFFSENRLEVVVAICFAYLLTVFELFRRFLYQINRQDFSLICTLTYFCVLAVGLVFLYFSTVTDRTVLYVFSLYCLALIAGILHNTITIKAIRNGRRVRVAVRLRLLRKYLEQGRFSLAGFLVTWLQNQGITPLLMFIGGAVVVGQFNIARMLMMPVVVVNTGIVSSAMPRLREIYRRGERKEVKRRAASFTIGNLLVSGLYCVGLLILVISGVMEKYIPDYSEVLPFLSTWGAAIFATVVRSWVTIYFIAAMKFRFLLLAGLSATAISLLLMALVHVLNLAFYLLPVCVLVGELYLYLVLRISQQRDLLGSS